MAKKRKAKLRVDRVLICAAILIAVIVGIVFLVKALIKHQDNKKPNPSTPIQTVDVESAHPEGNYLEIEQDDCTLAVGSVLMLTCKSNPEELTNQVIWSTTNADILTVDSKGRMEVVGEGTAAVIAVAGTYTDSIIVDAVGEEDASEPETDASQTDEQNASQEPSTNGNQDSTNPEYTQTTTSSNQEPSGEVKPSEQTTTSSNEQPTTEPVVEPSDEPTNNASQENPTQSTENPSQNTDSAEEETEPDYAALLAYTAQEVGFTPYYGGAYEYREDGNYLGVAIITDSMMQIYLKTRTTSFDQSIKSLLAVALPNSYNTAYAQLLGATQTVTLRLDGMKVRIIVPSEGNSDHKQLILYYE